MPNRAFRAWRVNRAAKLLSMTVAMLSTSGPGSTFFRIKTVIPGTLAGEAGLQPSDVIEQVNGMPAAQWTMETLEAALSEPGRTFDPSVAGLARGEEGRHTTHADSHLVWL